MENMRVQYVLFCKSVNFDVDSYDMVQQRLNVPTAACLPFCHLDRASRPER